MQAQSTSTHSLCLLRFFSFFFSSFFLSFLIFVCVFVFQKNNTKAKVLQTHRLEAIIMYIVARERPSFTYTWCNTNSRLQSSFFFFFRGQNCRQPIKKKKKERAALHLRHVVYILHFHVLLGGKLDVSSEHGTRCSSSCLDYLFSHSLFLSINVTGLESNRTSCSPTAPSARSSRR